MTEEIRYIANLQRQEKFDNEVTELKDELKRLEQLKNKYYQQTLDDEITISDLIEEIQELKADRTLERISKLSIENASLEQENKELRQQYNCYACDTCQGKEDYRNMKRHCENAIKTVHNYRSALEEINLILDELKQQYDYMTDYSEIKEIQDKINEVIG